jgi:hypothetical protein
LTAFTVRELRRAITGWASSVLVAGTSRPSSSSIGDGLGFDVRSFDDDETQRLIEDDRPGKIRPVLRYDDRSSVLGRSVRAIPSVSSL